ncbi:hypothetical protein SUGI_1168020 [Cryptomeria japonica]|uniref:rho GTPase-activating protein 5 n=1 Tax=Cryptomeria japonica TaxID=3369 RepID=UPI0024148F2D|nr:rho GTPase-activating protein 5 [Cryptomeria japonica]GLJ54386.1 hypothetical protein SUGI_1168020 [Cryptomeria japonica]
MTEVLPSKHYSPEYSSSNSSTSQPPSDDDETAVNTTSPLISQDRRLRRAGERLEQHNKEEDQNRAQLSVLALLLAAFRKSLVTCRADREDSSSCSMEISWPTNVRHVAHVTFDRFNGFLGLPVEFELEVPRRVPSASASVFGVSAESMQCSYDSKGNSVPTILLLMQQRLYAQGGLKAEGIFRINAENSQEEHVRNQLNKGIVPHDIDLHCLAGLIKAWFRELPRGVLDSLTHEQVMQCNTEEECLELVNLLPPTQAALLDWAINLMADVVEEEQYNKMNSRNIAMVFAPNMTQMADPLTALMYAVQVMNFLKTLIQRTLKERQEAALDPIAASSCRDPHDDNGHGNVSNGSIRNREESDGMDEDEHARGSVESYSTGNRSVDDIEESFLTFDEKDSIDEGGLPPDSRVDNLSSSDSPGNEMKKSGGTKLEGVDVEDVFGVKKGAQMLYSENNHWKASTSECDSLGIHEVIYNSFQRNNVEINKGVRKEYPQCMIQMLQPTEKPKGISVINHINQQVERAEAWR